LPAGSRGQPSPYVHRFGNVPFYVLARFLAFAIDFVVIGFVIATFEFNLLDRGILTFASRDENGFLTLTAVALGAALVFALLSEALFGTTIGKLVFALHVRRPDGGHAGVGRAAVRSVLRPIDLVVVGPVLALATPRHQRAGDLAAGTVVSRSSLGALAVPLGVALLALLVWAQFSFGGGLGSALGVSAQAANAAPDVYARIAGLFGVVVPVSHAPGGAPFGLPSNSPQPASPGPEATGEQPGPAATGGAIGPAPTGGTGAAPGAEPSDAAPGAEPTDAAPESGPSSAPSDGSSANTPIPG